MLREKGCIEVPPLQISNVVVEVSDVIDFRDEGSGCMLLAIVTCPFAFLPVCLLAAMLVASLAFAFALATDIVQWAGILGFPNPSVLKTKHMLQGQPLRKGIRP